ncbi:nicotinamide riboside kinase [Sporothrix schenckii 1099-18]|uniref:Nicotinamide riboside kinase n=1 Tax=Sporothrix schenckii 1099-18 TaxID=1397361 RepID=A0A0F2M6X0_SPOSC|nr:nicotinamide riboside kinase [Sporothrix schenckii 1099-18]KJR83921.1 nicotinamide riboside kinase [Sporothrix schenckii 1099-18]
MATVDHRAIVVGISGCSSSGKTTLARLLRDVFPNSFILHEDDFYKNDKDIPISVDGLADWDCAEALSLPDMEKALLHIRTQGALPVSRNSHLSCRTDHGDRPCRISTPPLPPPHPSPPSCIQSSPLTPSHPQPSLFSKEDQNSVGNCPVPDATIEAQKAKVQAWLQPGQPGNKLVRGGEGGNTPRICFFDGFLLYSEKTRTSMELIDVRLFLRVSHAKATQRREARDGYVTLEGFWKDPPGYVDKIVWPNYVEAHKWLFDNGDVEGTPNKATLEANRILTQLDKSIDIDMVTTLEWAVDTLIRELENKYL